MTWKHIAASVTGTSHKSRNESGQDYCRAQVVQYGDREFFIGIAADGAGSTSEGGTGAQIACDTLFSAVTESIRACGELAGIPDDEIGHWVTVSREAIRARAEETGKPIREYASTLIGCIVADDHTVFLQIGDGGIVISGESGYSAVFWPDQGEYANTTFFITDEAYLSRLSKHRSGTPPGEIAIFTDGLQNLVLSFSQKTPHAGFFTPLFDALRKSPGGDNLLLTGQLRSFLESRGVSERSDDDKTLVLAIR